MGELIEGKSSVVINDERFRNSDGTPATWVHTYTRDERLKRTILPLAIGGALSLLLLWMEHTARTVANSWPVALIPLVLSLPFALFRWWVKAGRRYSSSASTVDHKQRWKDAQPYINLFVIVEAFVVFYVIHDSYKPDNWQLLIIAPIVLLVPAFFALAGKGKSGYTPAARQAFDEHQRIEKAKEAARQSQPTWFDKVTERWWFRYPFGIFLGWAYFTQILPDPKITGWKFWLLTFGAVGIIIAATREVSVVLLGGALLIGIAYAIFGAISALPVGAAIIIGALIIATAISNKK
jgi:hypothetical protein